MKLNFRHFLSTDSAKAAKASGFGYLNGINYMAPAETILSNGKRVNLCPNASPACILLCLGKYSGQASMVADLENGSNSVRRSRAQKAEFFMLERQAFMNEFAVHIARLIVKARKMDLEPCVRPNGSTDVAYEGIKVDLTAATAKHLNRMLDSFGYHFEAGTHANIFDMFPAVQFVDYTKIPGRFQRKLPANYWLTFSRAENNEAQAVNLLSRGVNVAVVFGGDLPDTWGGSLVIDGDTHDLRHLDPRGAARLRDRPYSERQQSQAGSIRLCVARLCRVYRCGAHCRLIQTIHTRSHVMTKESQIVYENGRFWVRKSELRSKHSLEIRTVYEVYEVRGTHSVKCATIDLGSKNLIRAIQECDRRASKA